AQGTAKGWVVSPNRTVALNDLNSTITVQGQTTPLPAGSTLRTPTDILVSTQQLQQWLPANFALTLDTMVLSAYSTEILPETARLARQRIWDNLRERTPEQQLGQLHTLKRSWLGWPSLKADYGTTYGQSEGKTIASNNLNLQAQGPMAGMDGLLSLNFQQGTNNQRTFGGGSFRLEKTATASETLLGPLQARQYELGDVNLPRIALMPTAGQGRGVALTNKTPGFAGSLNEFELQGPGPQGWDVEVYQNDNLLTFGQVGIDGRYRFTNLNLRPGQNSFRVVLYGPQGEKQESTQNFTLGENLVKPGEWIYEAGVLESQNSVIATGQSRQAGVPTLVLNSFYGLNRNLTLNVGVAQGPMGAANQTTTGANLGLRAAYGRSFTQLDATMLAEGDLAASLREKVRLGKDTDVGAFLTRFASSTLVAGQATGNYGADFTSNFQLGANLGVQFAPYAAVEPAAGPSPQPAQLGSGPNYKLVPARGEGFGYAVADVVTFIDENTNGTRDANEETVAGVEVRNLRSGITATTNAAGSARITALLPNSNNTLEVIESTLPSLTLKPASVYHTLIAQGAGYSGQVAIALVYQAEVTGQLSLKPNQSAGGLQITLTNTKGEKLETTTPDAEGNFSFQPVPTGSYQVTVQNAQGQTTQTPLTITKTNLNPVLELPVP
ncbi:MAG: hypothetical protein EBR79_01740, partial [Proteobacteria bacterium]|nr:hypothetical protein [Pseudomonadota bacterium]